jgi:hypothetical protein
MPKSNKRKNTKLHCQWCGTKRKMFQFLAINTEQKDGKPNEYPFDLRRFLDLIQGDKQIRLPKYYTAICGVCMQRIYFKGKNRGTTLEVVVV